MAHPVLELAGVKKAFRRGGEEVVALAGVDLDVPRGEFLLVMGPSGSGKSTLLHLAGGLDRADAGSIWLDAGELGRRDLSVLADEELARLRRRAIGFVFQEFHLLPTLSAEENVMLPLLLDGIAERPARTRAQARLEQVELSARRAHLPDQLSGGERQRVAIARALIADPLLLLCDEPTGSLDSTRGKEILALLRHLVDEERRTAIVVTHDTNALPFAHRTLQLRDGRLDGETRAR